MSHIKISEGNGWRSFSAKALWFNSSNVLALIALSGLIVIFMTGCREDPTIWSARTESSDNNWIAYAHTVQHSGMGADGVETIVELERQTRPKSSIRVLGFADDGSSMGLKMNWVTPSHLEVTFKDDPKVLYYQVVKTSGIEISVRNLGEP